MLIRLMGGWIGFVTVFCNVLKTSVKNENITNSSLSEISDRLLEFLEFRFTKSDNENWKDYFEK